MFNFRDEVCWYITVDNTKSIHPVIFSNLKTLFGVENKLLLKKWLYETARKLPVLWMLTLSTKLPHPWSQRTKAVLEFLWSDGEIKTSFSFESFDLTFKLWRKITFFFLSQISLDDKWSASDRIIYSERYSVSNASFSSSSLKSGNTRQMHHLMQCHPP